MTTITAKMIAHSVSPQGIELPTMQLRYPLIIHAESKTHRVLSEDGVVEEELTPHALMSDCNLSRNARSSRAVPISKMIDEVMTDPFIPLHWGAAQGGMQAYAETMAPVKIGTPRICQGGEIDGPTGAGEYQYLGWYEQAVDRESAWLHARDHAVKVASAFAAAGYAKQLVNRLLLPFLHIDTLVSATELTNFFALRDHDAAEPHMRMLAVAMKKCIAESTPTLLQPGQWHLPYVDATDEMGEPVIPSGEALEVFKKLSVARCARISYAPFDGDATIEAELRRYDLLVGGSPLHASPCEHQATPDTYIGPDALVPQWRHPELHGNLRGWRQFRKSLPNESASAPTCRSQPEPDPIHQENTMSDIDHARVIALEMIEVEVSRQDRMWGASNERSDISKGQLAGAARAQLRALWMRQTGDDEAFQHPQAAFPASWSGFRDYGSDIANLVVAAAYLQQEIKRRIAAGESSIRLDRNLATQPFTADQPYAADAA